MIYKVKLISIFLFINVSYTQDFDDLSFGTDTTFEIMTWNIEWFPKNGLTTVDYVGQIIQSLEVDVLAIQEVSDTVLFTQMLDEITGYEGYFQSLWFAGLAYIYRMDVIQINDIYEIYTTSPYWSPFPRSPMVVDLNFMGENIFIINNHFKCCGDGILDIDDPYDEETRRFIASNLLNDYIATNLPNEKVIVLGDLNDILTDDVENNVFLPFLLNSDDYQFADMNIAQGPSSGWSYPWWPSHIDHILITNEFFDIFENDSLEVITIPIDDYMEGGFDAYYENISDHRPVAWKFNLSGIITGDINIDDEVNILDIIETVNLILQDEYFQTADLNNDGTVDILDIILIINIILGI